MNTDFSLSSMTPLAPLDASASGTGTPSDIRVKQVARAMEGMFAGQLMAELGKGLGGSSKSGSDSPYQDFIQQAMSQQVTSGGGFGLAKFIENYLHKNVPEAQATTTKGIHSYGRRIE